MRAPRPASLASLVSFGLLCAASASPAFAQGSVTPYGSSCGPGGTPTIQFNGVPSPGAAVSVQITQTDANASIFLMIGISDTASVFGPLPLALPHPPFAGGCQLLTSAEIIAGLGSGGSPIVVAGTLPVTAAGTNIYLQALSIGPTSSAVSGALDVFILPVGGGAGDVSGLVTAGGQPAADTRVTIFNASLAFFSETRTDGQGNYSFQQIPDGGYRLGFALENFEYDESALAVASANLSRDAQLVPETHPGSWAVIGDTLPEVFDASDIGAIRPDGTIMYCHDTRNPIVFNPVTGTKIVGGDSGTEQGCMNTSYLEDGSLLFCGGQDGSDPGSFQKAIPWVKRYQTNNTWTGMPWMLAPTGRWYPGLARLNDGRVLVFGGGTAPSAVRTDTAEIFDPQTNTWSFTGTMGSANEFAPSVLLYGGKVLRSWGTQPELYDPQTGVWTPTGDFVFANRGFPGHSDHSLLCLTDGRALAVGVNRLNQPTAAMTEFYDPQTGTWSTGPSADLVRFQGEVVYLPDGQVFFGAGDLGTTNSPEPNVLGIVRACDLFDPVAETWRRVADMPGTREYHGVTLLIPDGRVVTTGGTLIKFQVGPTTSNVEAYSPPYLFRGVRPQLSALSDTTPGRGQSLTFNVFPQTALTEVVLMGMQTTTHWLDGGVPRRLEIPVSQTGAQAQVILPTDPNLLPVGWYFLIGMVDDIPSTGLMVYVG